MRWIRFSAPNLSGPLQGSGARTAFGIVEGDTITEVAGCPFTGYETTRTRHALADVRIEIPLVPQTFYAAGLNYSAHVIDVARKAGKEPDLPKFADIGYRANNALIAHGEPVVIPRDATEKVQYEGELVAVIGKRAKNLAEAEALSCVLGYTIGNDVSERTWQKSDRTLWRAKNTDTFKPLGPWIETVVDLDKLETIVRVNGQVTERFQTNAMLFGVATFIARMTKYVTLHPGDMIWMGTDGHSENMKVGDVCEIEITGIGTLRNPFMAER
jgi:2-keto-4-pentenoate hydratase/2-oxohepta-3-ene-1,7-dioic acid hydratase in catechol pathway